MSKRCYNNKFAKKSSPFALFFTTSKAFFSCILLNKSPQTSSLSHESFVQPQPCGVSLFNSIQV